jgi:hypothetical protein
MTAISVKNRKVALIEPWVKTKKLDLNRVQMRKSGIFSYLI